MLSSVLTVTPPAMEPVAREIAKRHCRIDHASDDQLIDFYIRSARSSVENYIGRALITQTLLWVMTPEGNLRSTVSWLRGDLTLPRGPIQSITSVVWNDRRGNTTTIPAATLPFVPPTPLLGYMADLAHLRARLRIGGETPLSDGRTACSADLLNLQTTFVAGYDATPDAIPQPIVNAVLMTVAFLYEHRGDAGGEMPIEAQMLLDPYRVVPI